jgi:hypothetical protein
MNKNIKIDLTAFAGAGKITLTGKDGKQKKCLVIPIEENHLYEGEKGIYADFIAWEMRERKENGTTHLLKQSLSKEVRSAMTDEQKKSLPIFGDMKDAQTDTRELETYSVPNQNDYATSAPVDDLPFD